MFTGKACLHPSGGNFTLGFVNVSYLPSVSYTDPWFPVSTELTVTCDPLTVQLNYTTIVCEGNDTHATWNASLPQCQGKYTIFLTLPCLSKKKIISSLVCHLEEYFTWLVQILATVHQFSCSTLMKSQSFPIINLSGEEFNINCSLICLLLRVLVTKSISIARLGYQIHILVNFKMGDNV